LTEIKNKDRRYLLFYYLNAGFTPILSKLLVPSFLKEIGRKIISEIKVVTKAIILIFFAAEFENQNISKHLLFYIAVHRLKKHEYNY